MTDQIRQNMIASGQAFRQAMVLVLGLTACMLSVVVAHTGLAVCVALLLAIGAFVYAQRSSPRQQVIFLMVALQLNIFSLDFGDPLNDASHSFSLRPGLPVAVMLLGLLSWRWVCGREKLGRLPLFRPLVALDVVYWLATLLHPGSGFFFRGLISCTLLAVNVGIFLLFCRTLLAAPEMIDRLCRLLVVLYTAYALSGILLLAINLAGLDPNNNLVQVDSLGNWTMKAEGANTPVQRPWSFEPNTGSQMAAVSILALVRALAVTHRRYSYLFASAVIFLGVVLTFARGAWVGYGAGIVASMVILSLAANRHQEQSRGHLLRMGTLVVGSIVASYLLLVNLFPYLKDVLMARLFTLSADKWTTGTLYERFWAWSQFIHEGIQSPLLGHGADSYRRLIAPPRVSENFLIESFHVSGIWGPLIMCWVHIVLLHRAWRALRRGGHRRLPWLVPLLCGYSCIFASAQMNPSMWGGFYWMLLGIVSATLFQCDVNPVTESVEVAC